MGCYDTVIIPCPNCGEPYAAQSKGGKCFLDNYSLDNAPQDVLADVNRHAPFTCDQCETIFEVIFKVKAVAVLAKETHQKETSVA